MCGMRAVFLGVSGMGSLPNPPVPAEKRHPVLSRVMKTHNRKKGSGLKKN